MRCYDRSTMYKKFGNKTITSWLFLSCCVNAKCFLLASYIYLGVRVERPVFWLGLFLTFDQKLISGWRREERGLEKNVLVHIFKEQLFAGKSPEVKTEVISHLDVGSFCRKDLDTLFHFKFLLMVYSLQNKYSILAGI